MCSKAKIVNESDEIVDEESIVVVGPVCVLPQWQKQGIGSMLMEQVKSRAKEAGYKGLVLYGNPQYYQRFGFTDAKKYSIAMPDGNNMDAFMLLELDAHSLGRIHGRCFESKAFEVSKEELALFEQAFTGSNRL